MDKKNDIVVYFSIVLAVLLFGGVVIAQNEPASDGANPLSSTESSPTQVSELEPNNSFGTPTPVKANSVISGTINPARELDWYAFEVRRKGQLEVTFATVPIELTPQVLVRNGENSTLLNWTAPKLTEGRSDTLKVGLPGPGRYYVIVGDKANLSSASPYSLELVFYPGDENEPNNSFGTAAPMQPTGEVSLTILPVRDHDWYQFEVERRGILELSFENIPDSITPAFLVRNQENSTLVNWQTSRVRNGATDPFTVDLPGAGRYYIVVAEDRDDAASPNPMLLKTRYAPGDYYEHNQSIGTASPIKIGQPVHGSILPLRDHDWYSFQIDRQATLIINCKDIPQEIDPAFLVRNAENSTILNWTSPRIQNGETDTVLVDLGSSGNYYIIVADSGDNARSEFNYEMRLTTMRGDSHEPNGSIGRATLIGPSRKIRGNIIPKGDMDWYGFDVSNPGTLGVTFSTVPDNDVDLAVLVRNAENSTVLNWTVPSVRGSSSETIEINIQHPGRYYIVVADNGSNARSAESYVLSLDLP